MAIDSKKRFFISDKYLISEQRGGRLSLLGILIAIILGITINAILTPQRITNAIREAARNAHKEIKIDFKEAFVSFSDGILPRFSVVIRDAIIESNKTCWMAPHLSIDEMELPISFFSLLQGGGPIQAMKVENLDLHLRTKFQACEVPENSHPRIQTAIKLVESQSNPQEKLKQMLRLLKIGKLEVHYLDHQPVELRQIQMELTSIDPKIIEIKSKTHLLMDKRAGSFLSYGNLFMEYKEFPEPSINTHIYGHLREGYYSFIANCGVDDRSCIFETQLKYIPLVEVTNLFQKINFASPDTVAPKQAWLSLKAKLEGPVDNLEKQNLNVQDLRLEGDIGELFTENLRFEKIHPLVMNPTVFLVKNLDVQKLLQLFHKEHPTPVIGSLGKLNGHLSFLNDRDFIYRGELNGLEFVFSNRGQQEVQRLSKIQSELRMQDDYWNLMFKDFESEDGKLRGGASIQADRKFENIKLKTSFDQVSFSSKVSQLMTSGGEMGPLNLSLNLDIEKRKVKSLKGELVMPVFEVDSVRIEKIKTKLGIKDNRIYLDSTIGAVAVKKTAPLTEYTNQFMPQSLQGQDLLFTQITGRFELPEDQSLHWKSFKANLPSSGKILTEGNWDSEGRVLGVVKVDTKLELRKTEIRGTRSQPEFVESK